MIVVRSERQSGEVRRNPCFSTGDGIAVVSCDYTSSTRARKIARSECHIAKSIRGAYASHAFRTDPVTSRGPFLISPFSSPLLVGIIPVTASAWTSTSVHYRVPRPGQRAC